MRNALEKNLVKRIYDKSSGYYDLLHRLGTFSIDNKGRKFLVNKAIKEGDYILDAGGGTGTTGLMAVEKSGVTGKLVILDISEYMLETARIKANRKNLAEQITFQVGDMYEIPYADNTFDVVLSTYSTCPLENPANAVKEMLRVVKTNGLLGIAHSTEAKGKISRHLSNTIESLIWLFPRLSLGCRNFDMTDDIKKMNADIIEDKIIGFIPWYFRLLILRKRDS